MSLPAAPLSSPESADHPLTPLHLHAPTADFPIHHLVSAFLFSHSSAPLLPLPARFTAPPPLPPPLLSSPGNLHLFLPDPIKPVCPSVLRVLMESHSNDSRDGGHHWWHPSFSHLTPHHRRPVLLSAAGETRLRLECRTQTHIRDDGPDPRPRPAWGFDWNLNGMFSSRAFATI